MPPRVCIPKTAFASLPYPSALRHISSAPSACAAASPTETPSPLLVDAVHERSATLSWPPSPSPTAPFRVEYGPASGPPRSLRTSWLPRVDLRNLLPGVRYAVRISPAGLSTTFCTAGAPADASAPADPGTPPPVEAAPLTELSRLEVRVGRVQACEQHPDADSLYVERVDVGEDEPRTIVSGLVKYMRAEDLVGRSVVVLCNLKPRAMRGVTSFGMLLCASNEDHTQVDPLAAPDGAPVGELVTFEGHRVAPIGAGNRASKAFDRVAAGLKTNANGVALYEEVEFATSAGPCFSPAKLEGSVS